MPWRLIQFIVLFAVFLVFIMCNLGNKCNISFGFAAIKDVPVFLTVFLSFMTGILCTLPFVFGFKSRKKEKPVQRKKSEKTASGLGKKAEEEPSNLRSAPLADSSLVDTKHYGID